MGNAILARDLRQPEGPAFGPEGRLFVVEMDETRACVTELVEGGRKEVARPGGRPTGLAIDGEGFLWVAGGPDNSLVRMSPDGRILARIDGDGDGPFLFPNDLAFGPDGKLYMTDSGMRPTEFIEGLVIRPDFHSAHYDGRVFQIDPVAGRVERRLASGLRFANGLAFGPEDALYVNASLTGWIYRIDPFADGAGLEQFSQTLRAESPGRFVGPDGMAFDAEGRLYCAIYGDGVVTVTDASGAVVDRLPCGGARPTNVAFRPGSGDLIVTEVENGRAEVIALPVRGRALHAPALGLQTA